MQIDAQNKGGQMAAFVICSISILFRCPEALETGYSPRDGNLLVPQNYISLAVTVFRSFLENVYYSPARATEAESYPGIGESTSKGEAMKSSITCKWQGKLAFSSRVGDHEVRTDASAAHGGDNSAASPKMLMMVALAGCTGVDVVAILKKMRIEVDDFAMTIESELTDEVPAVYSAMHLIYEFAGAGLDREKLRKAVELSQDKYCGVSAMYRKIMAITWEIRVRE